MHYKRYLSLLLAGLGLLALMGVLRGQSRSTLVELKRKADPEALRLLEQALAVLDPVHLSAVETQLWQRVRVGQLDYEAEGRYLRSPDARFRLELHTRVGGKTGSLVQVCDGRHFWQGTRTEPARWLEVHRTPVVKSAAGAFLSPSASLVPEQPEQGMSFSGVYPLLDNLRKQLIWVGQEKTRLAGAECYLLTGSSAVALAARETPLGKPWPHALPGMCRLWLDGQTYWPRRVEWLTPDKISEGEPRLLAEMELRSPVFNPVLPEARCQTEFHFDPENTPVLDPSDKRGMSKQLALTNKGGR